MDDPNAQNLRPRKQGKHDAEPAPQTKAGLVTGDPAKGAPAGTSLRIQWMNYHPVITKGAGELGNDWTHFDTALLALCFSEGTETHLNGSAVLIGPGLALAAKHVLEPLVDRLVTGIVGLMAVSITEQGLVLWNVHQIIVGETDVAILRLDLASEFPPNGIRCATLSTRTPAVGERLMIAGVRGEQVINTDEPLDVTVRVGVGEVSAVYPVGRDRLLLPTPCIEARCLTVGGMSGGPAFDINGHLIGILTSSIEDDDGPSNISSWWPIAANKIESLWLPGFTELPTTLLDMANSGAIEIIGAAALIASKDEESNVSLNYRPWT